MLEPELEPKTLDVWSWSQSRSLKSEFQLHSPGYMDTWSCFFISFPIPFIDTPHENQTRGIKNFNDSALQRHSV